MTALPVLAMAQVTTGSEQDRQARAAEIQRLRARAILTGRIVATLLLLALAAMAVARYL